MLSTFLLLLSYLFYINKMCYALLCLGDGVLQHIFVSNTISVLISVPPTQF